MPKVNRCKRCILMRVPQVGAGKACTHPLHQSGEEPRVSFRQGSRNDRCAPTGGAGRKTHTKEVTGEIPLNKVAGWWQWGHQPGRRRTESERVNEESRERESSFAGNAWKRKTT